MKKGAILVSSIELADKILNSNSRARYQINNYFKKNRFAGAKDKKKITDLVFKYLKNPGAFFWGYKKPLREWPHAVPRLQQHTF